jgi:hypothetical protein
MPVRVQLGGGSGLPQDAEEPPPQSEQPPPQAEQPASRREPAESAARLTQPGSTTRLTPRGAVVAMFWLFFLGALAAGWLHLGVLTGLSFVGGCGLAARYTRRDGLLPIVASPPLIFIIALVTTEALSTHAAGIRRSVESIAEGTFLTLAGVAPWLFAGVILGLAIAMTRGLPQCLRDLAADLRGDPPGSARTGSTTRPGDGHFRPSGQGGARG